MSMESEVEIFVLIVPREVSPIEMSCFSNMAFESRLTSDSGLSTNLSKVFHISIATVQ